MNGKPQAKVGSKRTATEAGLTPRKSDGSKRKANGKTAEEMLHSLKAIDYQGKDEKKAVKQVMEQMSTVGFCLIANIPGFDEDDLLKACVAFHQIPIKERMTLALNHFNRANKNLYRGFFPFLEGDTSHKEFYDMTRKYSEISEWEKRHCPLYEERPWFKKDGGKHQWILDKFDQHFNLMHEVSLKLLRYLSVGLGKKPNYFEPWFKKECTSTFRAIHYNPRQGKFKDQTALDAKNFKLVTPEHADSGFLTLLNTFMFEGLQVEIDGEYRSIKPVKNTIALNIGEILSRISNYKIKATRHRVLDIGVERYSCPFFLEPKFSARISDNILQSKRRQCEDLRYDKDPANAKEVKQLRSYAEVVCSKLVGAYGEWHGFTVPKVKFDYHEK